MTIDLEDIEEDATEKRPSSPHNVEMVLEGHSATLHAEPEPLSDCPSNDLNIVVEKDPAKLVSRAVGLVDLDEQDEDFELRAMFYLPKWNPVVPPSTVKLLPGGEEGLQVLLSDVAELLSRSPPPLDLDLDLEPHVAASPPPAPWRPQQPFQVSFTLDVEDEEDDLLMMMMSEDNSTKADKETSGKEQLTARPHLEEQQQDIGCRLVDSPTWDEVFDEEDKRDDRAARESDIQVGEFHTDDSEEDVRCRDVIRKEEVADMSEGKPVQPVMENSMDLFEDDEAFLQMTIPDISTPAVTPRTSPGSEGKATVTKHMSTVSRGRCLVFTSPTCEPSRSRLNPSGPHTPSTTGTPCQEPAAADFFSVNFDLGYSLEDSEEEQDDVPAPSRPCEKTPVVGSSTPLSSFLASRKPQEACRARLSTPLAQAQSRGENSCPIPSPLTSPVCLLGARRVVATPTLSSGLKRRRLESQGALPVCESGGSHPHPGWCFFIVTKHKLKTLNCETFNFSFLSSTIFLSVFHSDVQQRQ